MKKIVFIFILFTEIVFASIFSQLLEESKSCKDIESLKVYLKDISDIEVSKEKGHIKLKLKATLDESSDNSPDFEVFRDNKSIEVSGGSRKVGSDGKYTIYEYSIFDNKKHDGKFHKYEVAFEMKSKVSEKYCILGHKNTVVNSSYEDKITPTKTDNQKVQKIEKTKKITQHKIDFPNKLWTLSTDDKITAKPIIKGDFIYLTSYDSYIYKIEKSSGKVIWKYKTKEFISSSVILDDKNLYVGSGDGNIYSLSLKDGKEKWRFKTQDMVTRSGVIVDESIVFGSSDGFLYGLDRKNGKLLWKRDLLSSICSDLVYKNKTIYLNTIDNTLFAFYLKSKKILWRYKTKDRVRAKPIVDEDSIIIADLSGNIESIDTHDGSQNWSYKCDGSVLFDYVLRDDFLYVVSSDFSLNIVDKKSGKLINSYLAEEEISSIEVSKNNIFVGLENGLIDTVDKSANYIKSLKVSSSMITSISFIDEVLYVTDSSGELSLYSLIKEEENKPQILTPPTPPPKIPLTKNNSQRSGLSIKKLDSLLKNSSLKYEKRGDYYILKGKGYESFMKPRFCKNGFCQVLSIYGYVKNTHKNHKKQLEFTNSQNQNGNFVRVYVDKKITVKMDMDLSANTTYDEIESNIIIYFMRYMDIYNNFKGLK